MKKPLSVTKKSEELEGPQAMTYYNIGECYSVDRLDKQCLVFKKRFI